MLHSLCCNGYGSNAAEVGLSFNPLGQARSKMAFSAQNRTTRFSPRTIQPPMYLDFSITAHKSPAKSSSIGSSRGTMEPLTTLGILPPLNRGHGDLPFVYLPAQAHVPLLPAWAWDRTSQLLSLASLLRTVFNSDQRLLHMPVCSRSLPRHPEAAPADAKCREGCPTHALLHEGECCCHSKHFISE